MRTLEFLGGRRQRRAILLGLIGACGAFATVEASAAENWQEWFWHPNQLEISGTPATSDAAGKAYSFAPTTSAPSGARLTYSISGKPAWAAFNAQTGRLAGTPTTTNDGLYSNIVITVSDGPSRASLAPFSISVTSPVASTPPTIAGTPPTSVNVGSAYTFTPSASDASGKTLTFSIKNPPSWTAFNTATGQISGTPGAASAGTYSNIVISVSDGTASAALTAFAIAVDQVSNGTATVNWSPPTENTNGTALTGLAGYQIHYGNSSNALTQTVQVTNVGLSSYTLTNLTAGTWYFGVTAYTSSGEQSAMSNVASKTVQ